MMFKSASYSFHDFKNSQHWNKSINGMLRFHREDGPAFIQGNNSKKYIQLWFVNGCFVKEQNVPTSLSYND